MWWVKAAWVVAVLAQRARADGARWMRAMATTQAALNSSAYFPKPVWERSGEERIRREREAPDPEVHGTRPAVGDYCLGGGGSIDGDQYTGSVLAMVVLGVVGDGCGHCGGY